MIDRLNVLLTGGVITKDVYDFGENVFKILDKENYEESRKEAFLTHLVMATMRIKNGEVMECDPKEVTDNILEEVGETQFERSLKLMENYLNLSPIPYPKEEEAFLLIHINTMIS